MATETTYTDKELFHKLQAGDIGAFDAFYRRHFDQLYLAAYRRLQHAEACKDIIQEVFTDCWQRREQISNDNPVAYLHRAVRLQVFKYAARTSRLAFFGPAEEMGTLAAAATDTLYYKELVQLIELWIDTLPEKRREIFLLHYKEHLSTRLIAEKLNISRKTVQNQIGLAFTDLRGKLPDVAVLLVLGTATVSCI